MQIQLTALTAILILATVVESIVEYLIKPWFEFGSISKNAQSIALRYVSLFVAVVLCIAYQVDALSLLDLTSPVPLVGYIVTGFLLSRGANYINDFVSRWLGPVVR